MLVGDRWIPQLLLSVLSLKLFPSQVEVEVLQDPTFEAKKVNLTSGVKPHPKPNPDVSGGLVPPPTGGIVKSPVITLFYVAAQGFRNATKTLKGRVLICGKHQ